MLDNHSHNQSDDDNILFNDNSFSHHDHQHDHKAYQKNSILFDEDYSDDDEKLFDQQNEQQAVAIIQESIDELLEKGKKKSLKYEELLQRRKTKEFKLMQLDEAKTYLLLYFARAFKFNHLRFKPINRAIVLSMIPKEYQLIGVEFGKESKFKISKNYNEQIQIVIKQFNSMFIGYLDQKKECLISKDQNFRKSLTIDQSLSNIEYLLLFSIFLSFHNIITRTNIIIDISVMERSKQIKVNRGSKGNSKKTEKLGMIPKSENNDKYQYGLSQKIAEQQKKRKYNDAFSERKRNLMNEDSDESEDDKSEIRQKLKKFRLNEENKEKKEQDEGNEMITIPAQSFFEKFAFNGKGSRTVQKPQMTSREPLIIKQTQRSTQHDSKSEQDSSNEANTKKNDKNQSHLFIRDRGANYKFAKEIEIVEASGRKNIHSPESIQSSKDTELTFNEGLFIEIYDELRNNWIVVCPFTNHVYKSQDPQIQTYFKNKETLFILSSQSYDTYHSLKEAQHDCNQTIFMREIGALYVNPRDLKDYLKAKNSCILTRYIEPNIIRYSPYIGAYADHKTSRIIKYEQDQLEKFEMQFIPQSLSEFKNNKYYTLPSLIRKYQGFLPKAQPLPDKNFRGEPIFLKSDLTELHTVERWKKHARQVKYGEAPIKRVKGLYNEPERLAELYGFWQTDPFRNELTKDGKIPMNKYGNIEIFNGPLPQNTVHIDLPKAALICRKLGFDHVPAVVGFEKGGGGGKSHPCISGIVTFQKHEREIREEFDNIMMKQQERQRDQIQKKAKLAWKQLIKSILVKRYMSKMYENEGIIIT